MQFLLLCVVFSGVVTLSKADTSAIPSFDAQYKAMAENLVNVSKKIQELNLSDLKSDFNLTTLSNVMNTTASKMIDDLKVLGEKSQAMPQEIKKKYDEVVAWMEGIIKDANTGNGQKLQESITSQVQQLSELKIADLAKTIGMPESMQKNFSEFYTGLKNVVDAVKDNSQKAYDNFQEQIKKAN